MSLFNFRKKTEKSQVDNAILVERDNLSAAVDSEQQEAATELQRELEGVVTELEEKIRQLGDLEKEAVDSGASDFLAESAVLSEGLKSKINEQQLIKERLSASGIERDEKVAEIITDPEILSYTNIKFDLPESEGKELIPGKRLVFVVPDQFKERIIRDVILRHRKGEKYRIDISTDGYDPHGAYSKVEIFNTETGHWDGWADPKGYNPIKFAEPRPASDPENEVLHDWVAMVGKIKPEAIRVTNTGAHETYSTSQIHGIEVVFFTEIDSKNITETEKIYCEGTEFIDLKEEKLLPRYGGGSHTEGVYEGAMALNHSGSALYELGTDPGPGVEKDSNQLRIKLTPGEELIQVEVAVGDTEKLSHISPKTKRHTRLGYAKLWVGIKRGETGLTEWFIQNANIPPQGVISGAPHLEANLIKEGDELVIESRQDAAYVMGWKVATKKPN